MKLADLERLNAERTFGKWTKDPTFPQVVQMNDSNTLNKVLLVSHPHKNFHPGMTECQANCEFIAALANAAPALIAIAKAAGELIEDLPDNERDRVRANYLEEALAVLEALP